MQKKDKVAFQFKSERSYRLVVSKNGQHQFGGPVLHSGVTPKGTDVELQLLISFDLTDPSFPIESPKGITKLPLYYPFKYGAGGSEVQYAIRSDSKIDILYLSDPIPDQLESQYLRVEALPQTRLKLALLTYEQARILAFRQVSSGYKPNKSDQEVLKTLDVRNLILVGGTIHDFSNAGDIICRNPKCEFSERRVYLNTIATIPPIKINGTDEFWWEFQGGDVRFCFGLCYYCATVIAFNVAS